jgi:DNA-binding MarR family transcriptional regulator
VRGPTSPDYQALARVRRSLRGLNNALARGAEGAGLTLQQQAFLLALAAYERRQVLLSDIREELEMDQATASELLAKLIARRLVVRDEAPDRRAASISFTPRGWTVFKESTESIRREMQRAQHRAELVALGSELDTYFRFYLGEPPGHAGPPGVSPAARRPARATSSRPGSRPKARSRSRRSR